MQATIADVGRLYKRECGGWREVVSKVGWVPRRFRTSRPLVAMGRTLRQLAGARDEALSHRTERPVSQCDDPDRPAGCRQIDGQDRDGCVLRVELQH